MVAPWLPIPDDHRSLNVESELGDDRSMLRLYIELLRLRKSREVLRAGAYHPIGTADGVLAYRRQHGDESLLIALTPAVCKRFAASLTFCANDRSPRSISASRLRS